jgi:2-polyprenyl-6-hydroxyphenyl methylase/3-demethylubiquinone-9 3-methyltransferase
VQFKPDADGHIFLLHRDEIEPLAGAAGLTIDKIMLLTNPLTAGHLKTGRLLRIFPRSLVERLERLSHQLPMAVRDKFMFHLAVRFKKKQNSGQEPPKPENIQSQT